MSLRTFGWSRTRTGWLAPLCTLPVRQSINALYIYLLTPGNKVRYGWEKLFEKGAAQCLENSVTMLYYLKLTASMILLNFLWPDISQWQFYRVIQNQGYCRVHLNKQYWDLVILLLSHTCKWCLGYLGYKSGFYSENKMLLSKWLHEKVNISWDWHTVLLTLL